MVTTMNTVAFVKGELRVESKDLNDYDWLRVIQAAKEMLTLPLRRELKSLKEMLESENEGFRRVNQEVLDRDLPGMSRRKYMFVHLIDVVEPPDSENSFPEVQERDRRFPGIQFMKKQQMTHRSLILNRKGELLRIDAQWQPEMEEAPGGGTVPHYSHWCELATITMKGVGEADLFAIMQQEDCRFAQSMLHRLALIQRETSDALKSNWKEGERRKHQLTGMMQRLSLW